MVIGGVTVVSLVVVWLLAHPLERLSAEDARVAYMRIIRLAAIGFVGSFFGGGLAGLLLR